MYLSFQQILIDLLLMAQDLGWALGVWWIVKYLTLPIGNAYSCWLPLKGNILINYLLKPGHGGEGR